MPKRRTIMRAIGHTRRSWDNHIKRITLAEGIPDSFRQVIMFLHHNPGSSQRSVAEFAGVTTSAVNQTVKAMVEEGYLRKEADPCDKRNTKLFLTEKGECISDKLLKQLDDADNAITSFLGAQKEAELMELLDALAEFVRKEL